MAAAQGKLLVIPQVAGVPDEVLLDAGLGDDGDLFEAPDVLGTEPLGRGAGKVEVLGSAGGAGEGRGLERGWDFDGGEGIEWSGDVLGAALGEGPVRGGYVEDCERDVEVDAGALRLAVNEDAIVDVGLCCCQLDALVIRVDERDLPRRGPNPCWRG